MIPFSVEDLTPDWLSQVLDTDVASVEVVDAHSGTTGRALIRLDSDGSVPETLFVKMQPFVAEQREFVRKVGMGVSEARFYAAVGDEVPVRVPRVWYSSYDETDGSFVMVLEDLGATSCRFPNPIDPDISDLAASLIDALATLHAAYWEHDLPWLGSQVLGAERGRNREQRMVTMGAIVRSALDQFADETPPAVRQVGELYISRYREIAALWNEGDHTLIHGDTHVGNLFVDGDLTGFFDWAVASRAPGMRDVSYFLCNSLPPDARRADEAALISRYRAGLASSGIDLGQRTAEDQYRLFAVYSWISAATTAAMGSQWQPLETGRRGMLCATQAIVDLDVLGLLEERLGAG